MILLYGANGYTGQLIIQRALEKGLKPIIAGRNAPLVQQLAQRYNLDHRVFALDNQNEIQKGLEGIKVVLHAAGPFKFTSQPMVEACLKNKTHYLDITGEIEVFERCASYDKQAQEAGIMVMPGAGFDVVPSDCLAAHLKKRLPDATQLQMAFAGGSGLSQGTAKTAVENLGRGGAVRKNGKILVVPNAHKTLEIDFGGKKMLTVCIPWGDVATAWRSTRIPDIEIYTGANSKMVLAMRFANALGWLLRTKTVRQYLKKRIESGPPGPSDTRRGKSRSYFWGKVTNAAGKTCISTQETPEGYTLTAMTSVAIAQNVLNGNFKAGYQTPSMAYGADFILEMEGCVRKDVV